MLPPISIYIHFPWCIRKCPYCDFNSYPIAEKFSEYEAKYISALIDDFNRDNILIQGREVSSIFFGGGTPTLFSPKSFARLIGEFCKLADFAPDIEITAEANPGSLDQNKALELKSVGINRISLGVQSFQDDKLLAIGRIHNRQAAIDAINSIEKAGFDNFNIDLMFGLPYQTLLDAEGDLKLAVSMQPKHISYYQLTIEPETKFHSAPPELPGEELIWQIQEHGKSFLERNGYEQYEVSAFCKTGYKSRHNINYWKFGDYIGIGAGAHGKISSLENGKLVVRRHSKIINPYDYLAAEKTYITEEKTISEVELPFEFMLNALRLNENIPVELFEARTGINISIIENQLEKCQAEGLLKYNKQHFAPTEIGRRYLNNLLEIFLIGDIARTAI